MAGSVLLIDDDVDVLRSIGNYFEHIGYEVTRELSGEAGLATFDRLRPEVVILDLLLPGMNGEVTMLVEQFMAWYSADGYERYGHANKAQRCRNAAGRGDLALPVQRLPAPA